MVQVEGTDDIVDLIPAPGTIYEEGTFRSKANDLSDAVAAMFGLGPNAVQNDVFSFLGKYNQHCWTKRKREEVVTKGAKIAMSESNLDSLIFSVSTSNKSVAYNIEYADEVTVGDDFTISLVNPQTMSLSIDTYSNANALKGKYVKRMIRNVSNSLVQNYGDGEIVFIPEDSVDASNSNGTYVYFNNTLGGVVYVIAMDIQELTGSIRYGENEYLFSESDDTYPQSGVVDGYAYQYCGIPFDNAVTTPKIATGSYMGTGYYYNSDVYNTLTFDFAPKFLAVFTSNQCMLFFVWSEYAIGIGSYASKYCTASWSGNAVTWYSTSSAAEQMNASGVEYKYIAIG